MAADGNSMMAQTKMDETAITRNTALDGVADGRSRMVTATEEI